MKRSTERILTTHVGSLPRPFELQQLLQVKDRREPYDKSALASMVKQAVKDAVRRQVAAGIDIVSDGELSKSSLTNYVRDRLSGLEGVAREPFPMGPDDFPDFTALSERYGGTGIPATGLGSGAPQQPISGAAITTPGRPLNDGPIAWKDKADLGADISNLKDALSGLTYEEAFLPAVAVGQVRFMIDSVHYPSEEDYLYALADALKEEYEAIAKAGFILQVDSPDAPMMRNRQYWNRSPKDYRANLELRVEALNHALQNVPEEQIRFHICWGNTYGTHHRLKSRRTMKTRAYAL